MLFINYWLITTCGTCVALLLLGLTIYRLMGKVKSVWLRQAIRLLAGGLVSLSSLLLLLFVGCGALATTNSNPIFSPNHRYAVRVSSFDEGAIGGSTSVDVYKDYGFVNGAVLQEGWKAVEAKDISWVNDNEILIRYPSGEGYDPITCRNFRDIKVTCIAASVANR